MPELRPGTTMYRIGELERVTRDLRQDVRELRGALDLAEQRISDLERLRPTCVICLDATADRQTVRGPACSDCVGDPAGPSVSYDEWAAEGMATAMPEPEPPEPEEYDPGPEADDEGGMSEYRGWLP
jgi:hypothetical protein